jgi:hypothetical protein
MPNCSLTIKLTKNKLVCAHAQTTQGNNGPSNSESDTGSHDDAFDEPWDYLVPWDTSDDDSEDSWHTSGPTEKHHITSVKNYATQNQQTSRNIGSWCQKKTGKCKQRCIWSMMPLWSGKKCNLPSSNHKSYGIILWLGKLYGDYY